MSDCGCASAAFEDRQFHELFAFNEFAAVAAAEGTSDAGREKVPK